MMLEDLQAVLAAAPAGAKRADYAAAVVQENCLSKPTASTRKLSSQRLGELYGLDPSIPLFRVMRRLWDSDARAQPLLALLAALARDPLLAATIPGVIPLPPGAELQRERMREAVRAAVGDRLNDSILEKVCRNAASTWAQAGHLQGRTFKKRRPVAATPSAAAFAMFLAHGAGFRGVEIFSSGWLQALDCDPFRARELAIEAKRLGLLDLRMAGDVVELNLSRLDPLAARM